MTFIHSFRAFL